MAVRRKQEPVHRIFYLCSALTADEDWQKFLKDCSFGKFPRGVRFENGALKWTKKKQAFVEHLPKDTDQAYEVINHIFRECLNIRTVKEKKAAKTRFNQAKAEARIQTWRDASTIGARNSLLRNYVQMLSSIYFFSESEARELLVLLEITVSNKLLDPSRIEIQDGRIVQIQGLLFDPFTRKISLQGSFTTPAAVLHPMPLDYVPLAQANNPKDYSGLLDYHVGKVVAVSE